MTLSGLNRDCLRWGPALMVPVNVKPDCVRWGSA